MPIDITDVERRVQYAGSGTGPYNFTFQILDDDDIAVYQDDTLLTKTTHYSVTINPNGTGSITTVSSIPGTDNITIIGARPYARLTDFSTGGDFFAENVNDELDSILILIQQLREEIGRALQISSTSTFSGSATFPAPGAGEYLRWNAAGTALETVSASPDEGVFQQSGTGAVERSWTSKVGDIISADDFGVDKTGATNTTTALKNFFDYCIASGRPGHIPAGTYLVTKGVLVFDNGFTDKAWPVITTDGHRAVTFTASANTDAPFITISNGTATSSVGKYWRGGALGGITFTDTSGAVASNAHGISIRGTWGLTLGWMRGVNLRGDLIHLPQFLYGGTNPDPYASSITRIEAIEAEGVQGWALRNLNFVGMDGWHIGFIRAVNCVSGVLFGIGSGCEIESFSVGSCQGWAFDDGTQSAATGGAPQRNVVHVAEFDNVENGIRLNRSSYTDFKNIRFIHRFQFAPNAVANYWPRTCVSLAGGTGPVITNVTMQVFHRIESGGVLANLGTFVTGNSNSNIGNVVIDQDFADNGALGVTNTNLFTGMSTNAVALLTRRSRSLFDTQDKIVSFARGSAATTSVPNGGFGTGGADLQTFGTQVFGVSTSVYNTTTSTFTAPRRGLYWCHVCIPLDLAAGQLVQLGFYQNSSVVLAKYFYAVTNNVEYYELNGPILMSAGDTLRVTAAQNSGVSVSAAPQISNDEVRFVVMEI